MAGLANDNDDDDDGSKEVRVRVVYQITDRVIPHSEGFDQLTIPCQMEIGLLWLGADWICGF